MLIFPQSTPSTLLSPACAVWHRAVVNLSISRNDFVNPEILHPSPRSPARVRLPRRVSLFLRFASLRHLCLPSRRRSELQKRRRDRTEVESTARRTDGRLPSASGFGCITRESNTTSKTYGGSIVSRKRRQWRHFVALGVVNWTRSQERSECANVASCSLFAKKMNGC